jgi:hypothetical protein
MDEFKVFFIESIEDFSDSTDTGSESIFSIYPVKSSYYLFCSKNSWAALGVISKTQSILSG